MWCSVPTADSKHASKNNYQRLFTWFAIQQLISTYTVFVGILMIVDILIIVGIIIVGILIIVDILIIVGIIIVGIIIDPYYCRSPYCIHVSGARWVISSCLSLMA
jgi:hypothetical protein